MKILIAGATAAIGKPLLSCLNSAGHQLFVLVRSHQSTGPIQVENLVADALDAAAVSQAVQQIKPDAIINELEWLHAHTGPSV